MMASKFDCGNDDGDGNSNNAQLLRDIEEISKALYLPTTPYDSRPKSTGRIRFSKPESNSALRFLKEDLLPNDKKSSSPWNWKKPLKALTHIGYKKFNCFFNLHVHSIEGLPLNFNGLSLCVHWKRKGSALQTRPSRVFHGVAEFDETLTHGCSVYGSQSVTNHSAKYESKVFLIYASIVGAPALDIGKLQVDLTRILPLSLEDLGGDKSSGKWTMSFRLTGKAKGASLNVSFGFQVIKHDSMKLSGNMLDNLEQGRPSTTNYSEDLSPSGTDIMLWQAGRVPCKLSGGLILPSHSDAVKKCHEVLLSSGPGFSKSISFLYQKFEEGNLHNAAGADSDHLQPLKSPTLEELESIQESNQIESDDAEFAVIEQGIETVEEDSLKLNQTSIQTVDVSAIEIINVDEIVKDDDVLLNKNMIFNSKDNIYVGYMDGVTDDDSKHKHSSSCVNLPSIRELDLATKTSNLAALNPLQPMNELHGQEHYLNVKSKYNTSKMENKSLSLDDITESVASDFLNMLGMESGSFGSSYDSDPQSPREQLLRQFEKEAIASGNFIFSFDENKEKLERGNTDPQYGDCAMDSDLSFIIQAAEEEHARVSQSLINRKKAKILEDLETNALMRQWGLNEGDFQNSPQTCSGGFGSPIELPSEEPPLLPSIGQGLGSFLQTKGGGFLRSMNPSLFRATKNGGNLIIQSSCPIVLPAKMGNDITEILLHVASAGVEELCNHINGLMPLQDITGRSIQQIVWDATTSMGASKSHGLCQQELSLGWDANCSQKEFEEFQHGWRYSNLMLNLTDEEMDLNYVSLDDVAPLTIHKIEASLIEGLRIQSGMSNEEAPSYIHPKYTKITSFGGIRANLRGFSKLGVSELQLEESGDIGNNVEGLMGLSMTLDQWLRLDAGIIEDQNLEQIVKILEVHHSKITDLDGEGLRNVMDGAKIYGGRYGLLGNHLTVAFVIQLRDPLRNYEPVGVPMLVLTQVERVYVHEMQQDHSMVFKGREKMVMENEALLNETSTKNMENANDIDEGTPQFRFKMNGIHVAGVLTKPDRRQLWGTTTQQQSGSRWLLASGMGRTVKHSFSKSKAIVRSSPLLTKKLQDILWSISSHVSGVGTDGKEQAVENVHMRNPDIIFSK